MSQDVSHEIDEHSEPDPDSDSTADDEALEDQLSTLKAENRRLREQYAETQRQTYRRTAAGLAGVGVLAAGTALLVPSAQQVLFALAGIGVFAAVLTWFLTPEHFIPIETTNAIYQPLAANAEDIAAELGLSGTRIYLETDEGSRLYIPEGETTHLPSAFKSAFVIGETPAETGLALQPTGIQLVDEFEHTHTRPLPETPTELSTHLTEGLVQGLELATAIEADVMTDQHKVIFEITESQFGSLSQFDHPIQSFLAVGVARGLETPVTVTKSTTDDGTATVVIDWADFVA